MSEADNIFKELRYELHYEDEYSFSLFNKEKGRFITFVKDAKTLLLSSNVTMQELQAINLKCRELGWIE